MGTAAHGVTGLATSASADSGTATVTVVHGVPGATVDVCANGSAAITGFTFKSEKTLSLPAGTYSLGIVKTGQACTQANYLASASPSVTAGENASVVAYLDASGKPVLGAYANDTSAVASGQGRLLLSHNAAAPGVNVVAGSTTLASGLTNGNQTSGGMVLLAWRDWCRTPAGGYRARWRRRASSICSMTSAGTRPIRGPMRSTATDRTCSACALESARSPVASADSLTWKG